MRSRKVFYQKLQINAPKEVENFVVYLNVVGGSSDLILIVVVYYLQDTFGELSDSVWKYKASISILIALVLPCSFLVFCKVFLQLLLLCLDIR